MIRVGIHNHHWSTFGGGEVSAGSLAEELSKTHSVTLLGPHKPDFEAFRKYLNIDLSRCQFEEVSGDIEASKSSENFDWFINHSFSSRTVNRAQFGIFVVMFPGDPLRARAKIKAMICRPLWRFLRFTGFKFERLENSLRLHAHDLSWVDSYDKFFAISNYTKHWVSKLWDCDCEILYPPPSRSVIGKEKEKVILSVGRFFQPEGRHSKKHLDLIKAFTSLDSAFIRDGWKLVLAGGCAEEDQAYLEEVKKAAEGFSIDVVANISGDELEDLYSCASIYWHATGLGESPLNNPSRFEHFGISVVEAMAAGVVPIVFEKGGPSEIVQPGINGLHWGSLDDLVDKTNHLISDGSWADTLRKKSIERSTDFDKRRYRNQLRDFFDEI
ncbi:MAG: Uncharacterised protein [Acidimicrobiales bacterium AG-410-I20]|nr:MAG: Uncharacterised protein [Acidimicrobiales bacterium AG-410-I20]